jgi:hypothetical protein
VREIRPRARAREEITMTNLKAGDLILFDHFGGTNRRGLVVKVTKSSVHVEWTAPSSGKTRVVKLSTKPNPYSPAHETELDGKNVRLDDAVSK